MISVTVYTTGETCQQCRLTVVALRGASIPFSVVDLSEDANAGAREFVTSELGYSQAPVVVLDQEPQNHWSGFRPDLIERLNRCAPTVRADEAAPLAMPMEESWMTHLSR